MNLSLKQHEAVMAAIRKRDARRAAERMHDHVTSGRETLLAHLRQELASDQA
jgi:DNA-binding GntR family transcriptional regulator